MSKIKGEDTIEFGKLNTPEYAYSKKDPSEGVRLKDRKLLKRMDNIHTFSFQDLFNMKQMCENKIKDLKAQKKALISQIKEVEDQKKAWEDEIKVVGEKFPEILEEEARLAKEGAETAEEQSK